MSLTENFVKEKLPRLARLNTRVDVCEMGYISGIITKYCMGITDDDIFFVLSQLTLAKNNLDDVDDVDDYVMLQHVIAELTDIIITIHDNNDPIVRIMPSEAAMIASALEYSLGQLSDSYIDVFNHGLEDMSSEEGNEYIDAITVQVKRMKASIQFIADRDEGTIVVKRANK